MKRRNKNYNLIISTLLVTINVVLAYITISLRIPLFFDTLGTMLGTRFFGLHYGFLIASAGSVISSFTDPYAIPYLPTYLATATMISLVYKKEKLKRLPLLLKALIVTIPSATIGGIITAYIFGGITSSSTSMIVSTLTKFGLTLFQSSLVVQLIFEYLDKVIVMFLMERAIEYLPQQLLEKLPKSFKK